jgi:hypothetical protein
MQAPSSNTHLHLRPCLVGYLLLFECISFSLGYLAWISLAESSAKVLVSLRSKRFCQDAVWVLKHCSKSLYAMVFSPWCRLRQRCWWRMAQRWPTHPSLRCQRRLRRQSTPPPWQARPPTRHLSPLQGTSTRSAVLSEMPSSCPAFTIQRALCNYLGLQEAFRDRLRLAGSQRMALNTIKKMICRNKI